MESALTCSRRWPPKHAARVINCCFFFEDYVLDTARRELRRGSERLLIEPQVFDLLAFLVKNRERVVSKDDLLAAVWGGRIVSESTLASRINAARRVIGDTGEQQRLIRTIIGKGVRFVGEAHERQDFRPVGCSTRRASALDGRAALCPFLR